MQYRFTQTILHSRQVEGKKHFTNRQKGALNESDPDYIKRSKHAKLYYEEIINSNREIIIKKLSEAVRINIKSAKKVYEHVLINEYDLADGHHSVYSFYV